MRITIELTEDQRAKLLALAAKRRLRGYSVLIQEAVERYLTELPTRRAMRAGARAATAARKIRGTFSESQAEEMLCRIEELWK